MEKKCINRLIGSYCKVITREPGEDTAHVIYGMVTDIDNDEGLLIIESDEGFGCLNITTVEAIKPVDRKY